MTREELKAQAMGLVGSSDRTGHKRIAVDLLYASESGDANTAARLTTDDFQFQFMRRLESWPFAEGQQSSRLRKDDFLKIGVPMVNDLTKDGMKFQVERIIEENDTVVIFGESNGQSKSGTRYNNRYSWRLTFTGDKVSEFLEFCDTEHAVTTFFS